MHWHKGALVLAAVGLLSLQTWAQAPSTAKKTASPGEFEQLIRQLGSSDFPERQSASKQLEVIGAPALGALRRAARQEDDLEVRLRAARLVGRIENRLDGLLADYQAHGLSLPPPQARLMRYIKGKNSRTGQTVYGLALEAEPSKRKEAEEVAPDLDAAADVDVAKDEGLTLAIQCHARGWDGLAHCLLDRSRQAAEPPPHRQLMEVAWGHWEGQITEPKIDRVPVARHLKKLLAQSKELDTEENRALLRSLELTLIPSKAKPGSVEAMIDDLIDYSPHWGMSPVAAEPEDRYWRIVRLGFDAVPALIEHLDDERLTRASASALPYPRVESGPLVQDPLRVGDVAADLLEGLMGKDTADGWLREAEEGMRKARAREWWNEARKMGEEAYLLARVLPKNDGRGHVGARIHLLQVIAARHPRRLRPLYRTLLEAHPYLDSEEVAEAVLHCPLPAGEKAALFVHAARNKECKHRLPALRALKQVDRKQFNTLLLQAIDSLPDDVPNRYRDCAEAGIAGLVCGCDDLQAWAALERAARRAAVGLRMEILSQLGHQGNSGCRRERLSLLSHFLDDADVRDTHKSKTARKFEGHCAASEYPQIEVRNFAALEMAKMLGINVPLETGRTPVIWAWVRDKVREACKREMDRGAREKDPK